MAFVCGGNAGVVAVPDMLVVVDRVVVVVVLVVVVVVVVVGCRCCD